MTKRTFHLAIRAVMALALQGAFGSVGAYTYNMNAASSGDMVLNLNSSGYGGSGSFDAVMRTAPGANVGVILLHGRGESYLDGHVTLPLRLALSADGLDTLSVDTAVPKVDNNYPDPNNPFAYSNFQYDINSGPNYVFPETFARIRAAEGLLQAQGATGVILVGFSLGSRMGANFMSDSAFNGVLPVIGYVGVGMGSDGAAVPLDSPTSIETISARMLDLYSSADNPGVFNDAALRASNYSGAGYTQIMQDMAPTWTVAGTGHQWVGFEPQLVALTQDWIAGLPVAPAPEPEIWAMMVAGLSLLGFVARRKLGKLA